MKTTGGPPQLTIVSGSKAIAKGWRISMLEADRGTPHLTIVSGSEAIAKGLRISMLEADRGPSPSDNYVW